MSKVTNNSSEADRCVAVTLFNVMPLPDLKGLVVSYGCAIMGALLGVTENKKRQTLLTSVLLNEIDGPSGDRTPDPRIKSPLLCQLS